jgi:MoaA/NifB/PqqE/SkfB family radical SAM enzyme
MRRVKSKWPHQDSIKVEWNLGKRCNLDCSYCPTEIHDNHSEHTNIKTLLDTVDKLSLLGKPVRLSLTGGEPTVHPDVEDLLERTREKLNWINMTTNGLRGALWYAQQPVNHYVFSLHFDNKHWLRALENIILFSKHNDNMNNIPFMVNVMAHHKYMNEVRNVVAKLTSIGVKYAVRRIRWTEGDHDLFDDMRYDGNDLQWILDNDATVLPNCVIIEEDGSETMMHANDIIKEHKNQFKGWSCSAGIESLMINWDGEVHRATCRVGGSLGNIYNGSFFVPKEVITCTRNFCTCASDIPLTKIKS